MVALLSFLVLLLPALLACTSPVSVQPAASDRVYSRAQREIYGVSVGSGVTRFVCRYANAKRWKQSTAVSISQGISLLQKVPAFSSYIARPPLTSLIHRNFLPLAPSTAQVQRPRTAFIWLSTFQTPSVLAATLPLTSGLSTAPLSFITRAQSLCFSGSTVDHLQVVPRAIPQSMALTLPPRPNPLSRLSNTGLAE